MLKLRNRLIAVMVIFASLLMIGSSVFFFSGKNASASAPSLDAESAAKISASYVVGQTLEVPEGKVVVSGVSYDAEAVYMYTPSNKVYSVGGTYVLEEKGKHTLVYVADVAGAKESASVTFVVNDVAYSSNSLTKVENLDALTVVKNSTQAGIKVEIPFTDHFKWNTPVDLAKTGMTTPLISFLPYQYSREKVVQTGVDEESNPVYGPTPNQASKIYVRLTDAYDAKSYVDIRLEYFLDGVTPNQMPSYSAGSNGNAIKAMSANLGRDSREGKIMFVEGKQYFVTTQERGGYPHLGGITENSCLISLYYDVTTNRVYVGQQQVGADYGVFLINDVDAKEIYGAGAFKGFETGEVYVSIFADTYKSEDSVLDLEIASIGFQEGEKLHKPTNPDEAYQTADEVSPVIKVDLSLDQRDNEIYVALGEKCKILPAVAKDVNLKEFTTKVEYNDQAAITINKADNTFTPTIEGKYTITYRAVDFAGNETIEKVVYNCKDYSSNGNKLISFAVEEYAGSKKAGTLATLPEVEISSPNKYVTLKTYAKFNGKEIAIDNDARTLKLDQVGKYTIVYEYNDVIESGRYEYSFTTTKSDISEIGRIALPKYILAGAKYSLDSVYATTYNSATPKQEEVKYEVSIDGGEYQAVADYREFKVASGKSTVQFRYTYGNASKESDVIKVVNNAYKPLKLVNYFQGNVTTEPYGTSNKFVLKANATSGDVTIDFVNPLSLALYTMEFIIPSGYSNYKSLQFTATDYLNPDRSVTLEYGDSGSGISFGIAGGLSVAGTKAFTGTVFSLQYFNVKGQFADTNAGTTIDWASTFESERFLLSITLKGITGQAGVVIEKLAGMNIRTNSRDEIDPIVAHSTEYAGNQKLNTVATLSAATGVDVVCPAYYGTESYSMILLSVNYMTEDGDAIPVKSTSGEVLTLVDATKEYSVKFNRIGHYVVYYEYTDQTGLYTTSTYDVYIVDEVKPTITIEGGYNEYTVVKAKLGDIIKAKDYTITDNYDSQKKLIISVVVFDPMYAMYDLIENDVEIDDMKFTATHRGEYVVYYYAQDTSGNVAKTCYRIIVE